MASSTTSQINISIRSLTGKVTTYFISPSSTILALKEKYQDREGIPPDQQRLVFNGRQLEDEKTLDEYELKNDDMVFLVLRLRKPVVYLESDRIVDARVAVTLAPVWSFSATYPVAQIKKEACQEIVWNVTVNPSGTLVDRPSGMECSYLYWEADSRYNPVQQTSPPSTRPSSPNVQDESFNHAHHVPILDPDNALLVSTKDIPSYLDQILSGLGLLVKARTDFITFWLPDITKHSHIALRFLSESDYGAIARLHITPTPEEMKRVFMIWKGLRDRESQECRWKAARERARNMDNNTWGDRIGLKKEGYGEEEGLRVLEWGGMEII